MGQLEREAHLRFMLGIKKSYANRKTILSVTALGLILIIIVISSVFPFIIDPTKWGTAGFISDELIILAITVITMVITMITGQSNNAEDDTSKISQAKRKFFASLDKILNTSFFMQWVKMRLEPRDQKDLNNRTLKHYGIENPTILSLNVSEIKSLVKIGTISYKQISKEQCKIILKMKKGRYAIQFVNPAYYLSVKNNNSQLTASERASGEAKVKSVTEAQDIISKVTFTLIIGLIFGALVYDTTTGVQLATAFMKLASRLFSFCSSSFFGYILGCQENDLDAEYIMNRVIVHNDYFGDITFVPKSVEEIAKEEYEEVHKNETI